MSTELPRWVARLNIAREPADYTDLLGVVANHLRAYASAEAFLGPYNARQRCNTVYIPPAKEQLKEVVKQSGMNDMTYFAFLNSLVRFCETTKGQRCLPAAHPSTIHSIQLPMSAFELNTRQLTIPNCDPVMVEVKNPELVKFVIVRPKLSRLGTASAKDWEALFFNQNHGYIPHWTDTQLNPRYSGTF